MISIWFLYDFYMILNVTVTDFALRTLEALRVSRLGPHTVECQGQDPLRFPDLASTHARMWRHARSKAPLPKSLGRSPFCMRLLSSLVRWCWSPLHMEFRFSSQFRPWSSGHTSSPNRRTQATLATARTSEFNFPQHELVNSKCSFACLWGTVHDRVHQHAPSLRSNLIGAPNVCKANRIIWIKC